MTGAVETARPDLSRQRPAGPPAARSRRSSRGPRDPTIRFGLGRAWRATRTADGTGDRCARPPAARSRRGMGAGRGTGPGGGAGAARPARRAGTDPAASTHSWSQLARRTPGVRIPRTGAVLESLVPAILEQKVTGQEAWRAWSGLVRVHGEPAPGPPEWRLALAPSPATLAAPSLLRLPPVRGRASPGRAHPAGRLPGRLVRGDRRSSAAPTPTRG